MLMIVSPDQETATCLFYTASHGADDIFVCRSAIKTTGDSTGLTVSSRALFILTIKKALLCVILSVHKKEST